jgi:hypothetical protein
MLQGIDVRERINFTFSNDKTEPKTVFILKPLTSIEKTIFSQMMNESNDKAEAFLFYLKRSIVKIKEFKTTDVNEALEIIDETSLGEVLVALNKLNGFTKVEAKNL